MKDKFAFYIKLSLCLLSVLSSSSFYICRAQLTIAPSSHDVVVSPVGDPSNYCADGFNTSEVHISIDKSNPQYLVLAANADLSSPANGTGFISAISTDGGLTWTPNLDFFGTNHHVYGDPSTAIDGNGNMYIATGNITGGDASRTASCNNCISIFGDADTYFLAVSQSHGSSFIVNKAPTGLASAGTFDKSMIAVDDEPLSNSIYSGNVYCTYIDYNVKQLFCNTVAGGNSFSPSSVLLWDQNNATMGANRYLGYGVNVQTGPTGNVYTCWTVYDQTTLNLNSIGLGFAYSTNGGNSFTTVTNNNNPTVVPFSGYDVGDGAGASGYFDGVRVNCFPSMAVDKSCMHNGRIYIVFGDFEQQPHNTGNKVIQLIYSDDPQGSLGSWQGPFTVSTSSSFTNCCLPWIAVDDITGVVYVDYYSMDNANSQADTWLACSIDGGHTFTNAKVSQESHIMQGITTYTNNPEYAGDYIGIAAHNGEVYPAWADERASTPCGYWAAYVNPTTVNWQIKTNTIWSSNMDMPVSVEIKPNYTLTIAAGTTIQMGPQQKIIVDPGATLINYGTITNNSCGGMWGGIEVVGNSSASQLTAHAQGTVILKPGSEIINAINGITTGKSSLSGGYDLSTTGGIIQATNAIFYNCQRAVQYLSYSDPNRPLANQGGFTNCKFWVDNSYISFSNYPLNPAVSMWDVHGVHFYGNTFENTSNITDATKRGIGVYSTDASFYLSNCSVVNVNSQCAGQPNIINGYYVGVLCSNSNPLYTAQIIGNQFTDNFADIDMKNVDYFTINQNSFTKDGSLARPSCFPIPCTNPYDLYIDQCTGYSVQGNSFTAISPITNSYGVICNNNGISSNVIYNNTFTNEYVGTQGQGINGGLNFCIHPPICPPLYTGLQFLCNQYTSNVPKGADIAVTSPPFLFASGEIDKYQGSCASPSTTTNNTFPYTCTGLRNNIYIAPSSFPIIYSYASTVANNTPNCVSGNVTLVPCPTVTVTTCSPAPNVNNISVSQLFAAQAQFNQDVNNLNNLLLAGDAPSLYQTIQNGNSGQIQNALLAVGPYLYDNVLIDAINKGLPAGALENILLPNSPLDATVMAALNNINLPRGVKNTILAAQTGISARQEVEIQMSFYTSEADNTMNSLIRYYLTDTAAVGLDSAEILIQLQTGGSNPAGLAQLSFIQLAKGETSSAQTTFSTIQGMNDSSMSNYCKLMPVLINLHQNPFHCMHLLCDSTSMGIVKQSALDSGKFAYLNARALLEYVKNQKFYQPIYPLPDSNNHSERVMHSNNSSGSGGIANVFKLYPNPANNRLTIEYDLSQNSNTQTTITMYDMLGNKVAVWPLSSSESLITEDISSLSTGFYIYSINQGNNIVQRGKLVIER